jgi:hypothetical protein
MLSKRDVTPNMLVKYRPHSTCNASNRCGIFKRQLQGVTSAPIGNVSPKGQRNNQDGKTSVDEPKHTLRSTRKPSTSIVLRKVLEVGPGVAVRELIRLLAPGAVHLIAASGAGSGSDLVSLRV